jgi:hypothetical protein
MHIHIHTYTGREEGAAAGVEEGGYLLAFVPTLKKGDIY